MANEIPFCGYGIGKMEFPVHSTGDCFLTDGGFYTAVRAGKRIVDGKLKLQAVFI
jgi:hypothetical protein